MSTLKYETKQVFLPFLTHYEVMTLQTAEAVICFPGIVTIIEMVVRALINVDFGLFPTLCTSWGSCTSGLGSVYKTTVAHVANGKLFFDHIGYPDD